MFFVNVSVSVKKSNVLFYYSSDLEEIFIFYGMEIRRSLPIYIISHYNVSREKCVNWYDDVCSEFFI